MMLIERKSTLTPVSGCVSPGLGLLCVEVVDWKLNHHIALGENAWSAPYTFRLMHSDSSDISVATTVIVSPRISTTSPAATTALSSPSGHRVVRKQERPCPYRQEVRDSIASRLPARSQGTSYRRLRTAIAQHLSPRKVNRATYKRNHIWANPNRNKAMHLETRS